VKTDPVVFIQQNTELMSPPHVPEIKLFLASEAHDLWLKTENELQEIDLPPPFWAFAWAGGQGLARYILDHPHVVRGKRVVDFASGSGLVAIAAAKAGAAHVLAVDIDPWAKSAIALNGKANEVHLDISSANVIGKELDADVLLAGDIFYDKSFVDHHFPWLQDQKRCGIRVLVGDPGRSYLPKANLSILQTYEVPVSLVLEDSEVKKTTVWELMD
jgi:predicted nicotinamide N-methyase